jgi:hypothetical protein
MHTCARAHTRTHTHARTQTHARAHLATQGRDDGLELLHWVKGYKDANGRIRDAQEGDYPFAKYNKKVRMRLFFFGGGEGGEGRACVRGRACVCACVCARVCACACVSVSACMFTCVTAAVTCAPPLPPSHQLRSANARTQNLRPQRPQVQIYRYDGEEWLNVISRDNHLATMGW